MRVLSATEALTPALERTRAMLTPYSLRLWFKLGLVGLLAEAGAQLVVPPLGNFGHPATSTGQGSNAAVGASSHDVLIAFAVLSGLVCLLGLALLYYGSRMQFVLMELVAVRSTLVRPSWRRYGTRTWPWIGLKVISYLTVFVAIGLVVAFPLIHLVRNLPTGTQPPGREFVGSFALIFGTILVAVFLLLLVIWTLRDFVLPFLLFEDAKLGEALRRAGKLMAREPGSVALYFVLKVAFSIAIGIAAQLCLIVALLAIGLPGGILAGLLWLVLRHADADGHLMMYVGFGLIGTLSFAAWMATLICILGATLVFYQAYVLYFLGGRLPRLGDLLEPPPPLPPADTALAV